MAKKGALINLVRSLTKAEKRYFRLFATQQGSNKKYLELFDFLESNSNIDDEKLKEEFGNGELGVQLHVTKNYLTNLIMKGLRNFHDKQSKHAELKNLLRDIEILYQKELYALCHDRIQKAKKIAWEYEQFPDLMNICYWEKQLPQGWNGSANTPSDILCIVFAAFLRLKRSSTDYRKSI